MNSDYPMDAVGGGLEAQTIRPNEIVQLVTVGYVESGVVSSLKLFQLPLKWKDVTCP
jgi:hypothetical protein